MTTTTTPGGALLLTVPEAAARLGIGRTLLYAAITSGALRSVRIGNRRLIRPEDLDAYVASLTA